MNPVQKWLGRTEYSEAERLQNEMVEGLRTDRSAQEIVLGLEHPLTITLGRRADPQVDIVTPSISLREIGISIVGADRGGQATLHGPGQLVIYPILNLKKRAMAVRDYVCSIESATLQFLRELGIEAHSRGDGPGVYTKKGKIAFFGVRVRDGITSHGLSINAYNHLHLFHHIRSCGKSSETFSRLQDYGIERSLNELFCLWGVHFQTQLSCLTPDVKGSILDSASDLRI